MADANQNIFNLQRQHLTSVDPNSIISNSVWTLKATDGIFGSNQADVT